MRAYQTVPFVFWPGKRSASCLRSRNTLQKESTTISTITTSHSSSAMFCSAGICTTLSTRITTASGRKNSAMLMRESM